MAPSTRAARGVTLACHPDSPSDAARGVAARIRRTPDGTLTLTYVIDGDLARMKIPAHAPARVGEKLWQHTCCEVFIACDGQPAYHEFNFAPSGAWAAYAFTRYREAAPLPRAAQDLPLVAEVSVRKTAGRLEVDASIRLDRLSPRHAAAKLSLAVSMVIEDRDGGLSYWALKHPPGRPDFHHRDAFALELDELRD
jgi:hypothetical protein